MTSHPSVMLCASPDDLSLVSSFALSLEELKSFPWLTLCSDAAQARQELLDNPLYQEAWVLSSREVEGINLAAAIKADKPKRPVHLVELEPNDETFERARAANVDGVWSVEELVWRCETYAVEVSVSSQESAGLDDGAASCGGDAETTRTVDSGNADERGSEAVGAVPALSVPPSSELSQGQNDPDGARGKSALLPDHKGFLLSVLGGSGGAGKSTVSLLAAALARRRGLRVALLDGDFRFGDLASLAPLLPQVAADDLLSSSDILDPVDDCDLVLVAAPRRLEQAEILAPRIDLLVERLLERFDVVVANTGGPWEEPHAFLLEASMTALILVDQRASSVRACRRCLDVCARCGIATGAFLVVLGRCGQHALFTGADVSEALNGAHVVELQEGGSEVEELLGAGRLDELLSQDGPLCASVDWLLDEVALPMGKTPAGQGVRHGLAAGTARRSTSSRRRGALKGRRGRRPKVDARALAISGDGR